MQGVNKTICQGARHRVFLSNMVSVTFFWYCLMDFAISLDFSLVLKIFENIIKVPVSFLEKANQSRDMFCSEI